MTFSNYWAKRGYPWEFDPGPPKNMKWPRLFSETPNFRMLSKQALGKEKFRWHFGPMYYRGRLGTNKAKILIIGQEGAQDESLSHRSFTGSSGSRLQHFLHFLGINYSYLFMNTFVYPIRGQYTNDLIWLAQNSKSPIVRQRHEIFNYVLEKNDIRLIVAVGNAAKETVVTWVTSRGGHCPDGPDNLASCTGHFLDPHTKIVGVLHPGGGKDPEQRKEIVKSFQASIDQIKQWIGADPNWLPLDKNMSRDLENPYTYSKAPIPFRDLPFGICWQLGKGSTSSNRRDEDRSIQIFSAAGKYNNYHDSPLYEPDSETNEGYKESPGDVPYEPPVSEYTAYDKGPPSGFSRLALGGRINLTWPDFSALGVTSHESLGCGPIFRGRPWKATILVLADQQSHDDLFTMRALTGNSGQHFQALLKTIGIRSNYCILRVLPLDTLDLAFSKKRAIALNSKVVNLYREMVQYILKKNKTQVILTLGSIAKELFKKFNIGASQPVLHLKAWKQPGALDSWQQSLAALKNMTYKKEIAQPSFIYGGERVQIPRIDLPYGVLKWQASSGDRAQRAKLPSGEWSGDYYKWIMPQWAFDLAPLPLSPSEAQAILSHP